ncbi:MAG: stage V sporulation protein AC [Clostridia bacterium]
MQFSKEEYSSYVETKSQKTNMFKNCFFAFLVGGLICCIGQSIVEICKYYGLEKEIYSIISAISLVGLGAFLTALRIYNNIGSIAGAGSIVPITGFANSVVSPAIEFKSEGYILGIGANMFKIAGPVLVYGIGSSTIVGIIYWFSKMFM